MTKEEIWGKIRHFKIETDIEKLDLIDTDVYLDLLNKHNDLQHQLEEKTAIINEAIKQVNRMIIKPTPYFKDFEGSILAPKEETDELLEILEGGKNENSKN